jgi:TPR repeat protein
MYLVLVEGYLLGSSLCGTALAQMFFDGDGMKEGPDYELGRKLLEKIGTSYSYFTLGCIANSLGSKFHQNYLELARGYFLKATELPNTYVTAFHYLGSSYLMAQNYEEMEKVWLEGHRRKDLCCRLNLGSAYFSGQHVKKDEEKALQLLNDPMMTNTFPLARYLVGKAHYLGICFKPDPVKGLQMMREAWDRGWVTLQVNVRDDGFAHLFQVPKS